ncbi:MAG: YggS family pyridoxal phosphate-dependent enzyme [Lentisphaeria bacterium]|nr:YggS family pyridoxal phosphate-dependent enzyme [Lentisphaeria bacterium]
MLTENLRRVTEQIGRAAENAGRQAADVRLVAVSKTVSEDAVREALALGQTAFGENRVQELERKAELLPATVEWHMIGHLQANKARPVVTRAAWIHSIDSVKLMHRVGRIAEEEGVRPHVLVQVNITGEESKAGVAPDEAEAVVAAALSHPSLTCSGLMTMAPADLPTPQLREAFACLRNLRDRLETLCGTPLPELSMGMSGDFAEAIAEGATLVRVGTAVFGARN